MIYPVRHILWGLLVAGLVLAPVAGAPAERRTTDSASGKRSSARGRVTRNITFDDIKFKMKKGDPFKRTMLSQEIDKLSGNKIRIRGYILPSFKQKGIEQFVLVRDNMQCCFGPGAALFDCIVVQMQPGKGTSFTVRPVSVEGIFTIEEIKGPDGKHLAIYHLKGEKVK